MLTGTAPLNAEVLWRESLDENQEVDAVVRTLAEALRQELGAEALDAAMDFVHHYIDLRDSQLLRVEQKVATLAVSEPKLKPMPEIINNFVKLGVLKGRAEGRAEGERAAAARLVAKKFPSASRPAAPLLKKLDEAKLLAFVEAVIFMDSAKDCLKWLRANS